MPPRHLPARGEFDSVNFAFGVEGFDLERHEPHPPGYLGYVFAARAINFFADDPNRSLTLLSVVSSGWSRSFCTDSASAMPIG